MARRQPPQRDVAPVAARYRIQYRKHGRLRFSSARDFQRALERALRRTGVPIAFSAGFSPHPKVSYTNTVPTGASSEAEYLELGLTREVDPEQLRQALDSSLPTGFDVVAVVPARTSDFANRLEASRWRVELPGVSPVEARSAVEALLAAESAPVERLTKSGRKSVDARAVLISAEVMSTAGVTGASESAGPAGGPDSATADRGLNDPPAGEPCAILHMVVRHETPSVRPMDVLTALQQVAGLTSSEAPRISRQAQGPLSPDGPQIADPLAADRDVTPLA